MSDQKTCACRCDDEVTCTLPAGCEPGAEDETRHPSICCECFEECPR